MLGLLAGLVRWVCRGERRGACFVADWGGGILVVGSSSMAGILAVLFFTFACGFGVRASVGGVLLCRMEK